MSRTDHHPRASRWLVVGHGSVGSYLASRLVRERRTVDVFDPEPRVAPGPGIGITDLADPDLRFDYVMSSVPPAVAEAVPALVGPVLNREAIFFDWNTTGPPAKERIGGALPVTTIDVALLDSLDGAVERPYLAISGAAAGSAAETLEALGFSVSVAGDRVGQAAALKYLRSMFMKTLEALVLEHASLAAGIDGSEIVRASLANNLGSTFSDFMDLLVRTNRVHADRRSRELADAVDHFAGVGTPAALAATGAEVLRRSAAAWNEPAAPAPRSDTEELLAYLRGALWPELKPTDSRAR